MARHKALTPAQQEILDGCEVGDGVLILPSYRLARIRSARVLERRGYVSIVRQDGGALQVTRTSSRRAL